MTDPAPDDQPKLGFERAIAAADAIAARGEKVTQRAVRAEAGVRQDVATEAVAAWKATQDAIAAAPEIPPVILQRLAALWAEAHATATKAFDTERAEVRARVIAVEAEYKEVAEALGTATNRIAELEHELAAAGTEYTRLVSEVTGLNEEITRLNAAAETQDAVLKATAGERDRLSDLLKLLGTRGEGTGSADTKDPGPSDGGQRP